MSTFAIVILFVLLLVVVFLLNQILGKLEEINRQLTAAKLYEAAEQRDRERAAERYRRLSAEAAEQVRTEHKQGEAP